MPRAVDPGTCLLVLPLRLGVGLISMATFASSCVCLVALATGDVRFMPNAYEQRLLYVPSIIGAFGLIFGFVGLLGAYDDKPDWLRAFTAFLQVKLLSMSVVIVADLLVLRRCGAPDYTHGENHNLDVLSDAGLCVYAKRAFLLGGVLELALWAYFAFKVWYYTRGLELSPTYAIDFGAESGDREARWRLYHVQDPRPEMDRSDEIRKQIAAMRNAEHAEKEAKQHEAALLNAGLDPAYGSFTSYGPDGMPLDTADSIL